MSALKPVSMNIPVLDHVDEEASGPTTEEKQLYAMSKSAGWKILRKIAEQAMVEMDNTTQDAIGSGASLEEIGRNTIVISLAKDTIRKLLNRVDDTVDACESNEK